MISKILRGDFLCDVLLDNTSFFIFVLKMFKCLKIRQWIFCGGDGGC